MILRIIGKIQTLNFCVDSGTKKIQEVRIHRKIFVSAYNALYKHQHMCVSTNLISDPDAYKSQVGNYDTKLHTTIRIPLTIPHSKCLNLSPVSDWFDTNRAKN